MTSIYTVPGKDILITLSESNIKVWDLEYDECIKNMNDHNSLIVYCALSHKNDQLIVTISQSLEYKEWNYVTGDVVNQQIIDIETFVESTPRAEDHEHFLTELEEMMSETGKLRLQKRNFSIVACQVSENDLAFFAMDNNKIIVYSLQTQEVLCIFNSYQGKYWARCKGLFRANGDLFAIDCNVDS